MLERGKRTRIITSSAEALRLKHLKGITNNLNRGFHPVKWASETLPLSYFPL